MEKLSGFKVGDNVYLQGHDDPQHINYKSLHKIIDFRQSQNASDDNYHWSALLEYNSFGEIRTCFYPVSSLQLVTPQHEP